MIDVRKFHALTLLAGASCALLACVGDAPLPTTNADGGSEASTTTDGATTTDGSTTDGSVGCNANADFGTPEPLPGLETTTLRSFSINATETKVYATVQAGNAGFDLVVYTLSGGTFGNPQPITELNGPTNTNDEHAVVSANEKIIAFTSDRTSGFPNMWLADRGIPSAPFGNLTSAGAVASINQGNTSTYVPLEPFLSAEGTDLYFVRNSDGEYTLSYASRGDVTQAFGPPKALFVNASSPVLSTDRLRLYYAVSQKEIYVTKRASAGAPFPAGTALFELSADVDAGGVVLSQLPSGLSTDGCTLYFLSNRVGKAFRAYRARRGQ